MATGITQKTFLGFRNNGQSCFSTSGVVLSYLRKNPKYRTIEDSFRNRRPAYEVPTEKKKKKDEPRWKSLEMRELYHKDPSKTRVLIRTPDYSFVDGRPTPLGGCMRKRLEIQMGWAEKIIQYSKEMDFAVERHAAMQKEAEAARSNIIESKLKPKGKELLNSDKSEKSPVEYVTPKLLAESRRMKSWENERRKEESLAAALKIVEDKTLQKEHAKAIGMKYFKMKIPMIKRLKRFDDKIERDRRLGLSEKKT